ncbi:MAG TPA: DUF805 domain-containing protein [Caulobacteraceae bacterium]
MPGQLDWLELFFSSAGRIARGPFVLAALVLFLVLTVYEAATGPTLRLLTGWLIYAVLLFSGACVLSKRLHDRGRTGWLAAIILLALVAVWPAPRGFFDFLFSIVLIWAVVELGALPGEQGANRYGPNPLKGP